MERVEIKLKMRKRNIKGLGAYLHLVKTNSGINACTSEFKEAEQNRNQKEDLRGKKEAGNLDIKQNSE